MTLDQTATRFLQAYAAGGEPEGGWLYGKALQQTRLDYMPDSLERLDRLLAQIRERAKPSRAELDSVQGRNFASVLAFYVIEVLRRRTGADFEWHDRGSALARLPAGTRIRDEPATRLVAVNDDQGVAFWPLGWIDAQLASEGPRRLAGELVDDMVAQIERHGPALWWRAATMLGQVAAWQMISASTESGIVLPTMLSSLRPRTFETMASSMFGGEGLPEAVQRGGRRLEENPEGATWQVLGYDGILERDGERLDSVMVVAKAYGGRPLMLKIAFPYRPQRDGRRFVILQPSLREASIDNDLFDRMQKAVDRGIQTLKWPHGESWNGYREGSSSPAAAASVATSTPAVAEPGNKPEWRLW